MFSDTSTDIFHMMPRSPSRQECEGGRGDNRKRMGSQRGRRRRGLPGGAEVLAADSVIVKNSPTLARIISRDENGEEDGGGGVLDEVTLRSQLVGCNCDND